MIKVTGSVKQKQTVQIFNEASAREFKKQVLIIETFESSTPLRIEFTNANIEKLADIEIGNNCLVEYSVQGNYDKSDISKVYNSLIAKSIVKF
jgi:hypothetical protein